jgi:hypothetical protein
MSIFLDSINAEQRGIMEKNPLKYPEYNARLALSKVGFVNRPKPNDFYYKNSNTQGLYDYDKRAAYYTELDKKNRKFLKQHNELQRQDGDRNLGNSIIPVDNTTAQIPVDSTNAKIPVDSANAQIPGGRKSKRKTQRRKTQHKKTQRRKIQRRKTKDRKTQLRKTQRHK